MVWPRHSEATTAFFSLASAVRMDLAPVLPRPRPAMVAQDDRMLQEMVLRQLPRLVDLAEARGGFISSHVVRYLHRFGTCGDPTLGFALLRCSCGLAKAVAFRCQGRGLCPTCGGRAMATGAAHLVDKVLPDVTVRQWVLSVPWPRRYLFAYRPEACAAVRRLVWRQLHRWYADRAAQLGHAGGDTGGVIVVQRFSSSLNLNVHFHMLLLDGVYVADPGGGEPRWVPVPAPTTDEVQQLVRVVAKAVEKWLCDNGYGDDDDLDANVDPDDQLGPMLAASVAGRVAHGARSGAKVRRLRNGHERPFRLPPMCGEAEGYNLHAGVVIAAHRRDALERLCRYVLRPPLARTRLHQRPDGLLVLTLRKAYADGTTKFIFSEIELLQKLVALVPSARKNAISYHGVLAPRHALRNQVIPEAPEEQESRGKLTKNASKHKTRWVPWADLLWRVFERDGYACACGKTMVLHAVVLPPATLDVLDSLSRAGALIPTVPPPVRRSDEPARAPPLVA